MAGLSLKQVRKVYPNGFKAIHGLDLEVSDGEFVVLVGPSGCGKSTLLRMIAGLETISEGTLEIDGRTVNDIEPGDRDIAMVFQNYALYPHMSVYNNMAYGLKNRKTPKAEIERKVKEAAGILELGHLLDRRPNQLSGGQRQRVAMGRAIVRDPKVFLFDEPLSNLDAKLRVQMRLEIKRLQNRLGTTAIYVTHDQVEAMTLADRLVVMNGGNAEQVGAPLDVYDRPATTFVAGFIGSPAMNFLHAENAGGSISVSTNSSIDIPGADRLPGSLTLGIRPEHLHPCAESEADMVLTVELSEPLGTDTLLHGIVDGIDGTIVARLGGAMRHEEGERIPLRISREHIHLFNADTGLRVGD